MKFVERAKALGAALAFLIASFFLASSASAVLTIEIVGTGAKQIPVAIVPFRAEEGIAQKVTPVVGADLVRSGVIKLIDAGGLNPVPYEPQDVNYGTFRTRGADAVVIGSISPRSDGRYDVQFRLMDTAKQTQLAGFAYTASAAQLRLTAHKIADVIYEKLTGDVGVFSTRIAYITKQGNRFELIVADADGGNPQAIVGSNEPLLSPAWSPDGSRIAYVSLENKKPVVYVQSMATGQRQVVANFRGSNSAPAWAPDGRRLAVTLTKDGSSQLYLINADGSGLQRLLSSGGIDTEPSFTPDGRAILFASDRGGAPQIYRMSLASGAVERMTFDGGHNVSPHATPDGKGFVFVRRDGNSFQLAIQDFGSRQMQVLTSGPRDESPSVSPNSKLILYAAEQGGRGILAAVSSDGRVKQRFVAPATDVREPAWGPLPR